MENNENASPKIALKGRFWGWLENFWYHYKWHSLIALFLVFTITTLSLQMCHKESYDAYILYAGGHPISHQSENGDFPEYNKIKNSLERFTSDYDDNGKTAISLRDLYIPNEEEMKGLDEYYYQRAYNDRQTLQSTMLSGDYFICFFAPEIYESYRNATKDGEVGVFSKLEPLISDLSSVSFYDSDKTAIVLSSTSAYSLAGLNKLPPDTVICLRNTNFSSFVNKKTDKKMYERSREILTSILNYNQGN